MSNSELNGAQSDARAEPSSPALFTPLMPLHVSTPWAKPAAPTLPEKAEPPSQSAPSAPRPKPVAEAVDVPPAPQWLVDLRFSSHKEGEFILEPEFTALLVRRPADQLLISLSEAPEARDLTDSFWCYDIARVAGWTHLAIALEPQAKAAQPLREVLMTRRSVAALTGADRILLAGTGAGADVALELAPSLPAAQVIAFSPRNLAEANTLAGERRSPSSRVAVIADPRNAPKKAGNSDDLWPSPGADSAAMLEQASLLAPVLERFAQRRLDREAFIELCRDLGPK